jgi:hypothetical protein
LKKVVVYDNIIFPLRRVKKLIKEPRKETTKKKEEEPKMPPPLVDDPVGDMVGMMYNMIRRPQSKPATPSIEAEAEPKTYTVDPFNDTPRQIILGDMLIGFYIVPNKTKSSAYGGRSFSIYFKIDPNGEAEVLKEKMSGFIKEQTDFSYIPPLFLKYTPLGRKEKDCF